MVGLVFFLGNQILSNAGNVYDFAPWVTAWVPTIVVATAAFWGLHRVG
jgi:lipopolysaccharide export LptBFGC system permease protein LptF